MIAGTGRLAGVGQRPGRASVIGRLSQRRTSGDHEQPTAPRGVRSTRRVAGVRARLARRPRAVTAAVVGAGWRRGPVDRRRWFDGGAPTRAAADDDPPAPFDHHGAPLDQHLAAATHHHRRAAAAATTTVTATTTPTTPPTVPPTSPTSPAPTSVAPTSTVVTPPTVAPTTATTQPVPEPPTSPLHEPTQHRARRRTVRLLVPGRRRPRGPGVAAAGHRRRVDVVPGELRRGADRDRRPERRRLPLPAAVRGHLCVDAHRRRRRCDLLGHVRARRLGDARCAPVDDAGRAADLHGHGRRPRHVGQRRSRRARLCQRSTARRCGPARPGRRDRIGRVFRGHQRNVRDWVVPRPHPEPAR